MSRLEGKGCSSTQQKADETGYISLDSNVYPLYTGN